MSDYPDEETDASPARNTKGKTQKLTGASEGGTDMKTGDAAGEDDGSAPVEGQDDHLKSDQKPTSR